jgi:tetratricopeptide (TPR) repeat protein
MPGAEKPTSERGYALIGLAVLSGHMGDYYDERARAEEALRLYGEIGADISSLAYAQGALALGMQMTGESAAATQAVREVEALIDKVPSGTGVRPLTMMVTGIVSTAQGDFETAVHWIEASLAEYRRIKDTWGTSQTLNVLGDIYRITGDLSKSLAYYEESLVLYRELDSKSDIPSSLHNIGHVVLALGDADRAEALFKESLALHQERGNRHGVVEALLGFAGVAAARGDSARAARLFGASDDLLKMQKLPLWPAEQADYDRNFNLARKGIDEAAWQAAWREGQAMSVDEAVAYALEGDASRASTPLAS